jgi:hypothetical protein
MHGVSRTQHGACWGYRQWLLSGLGCFAPPAAKMLLVLLLLSVFVCVVVVVVLLSADVSNNHFLFSCISSMQPEVEQSENPHNTAHAVQKCNMPYLVTYCL